MAWGGLSSAHSGAPNTASVAAFPNGCQAVGHFRVGKPRIHGTGWTWSYGRFGLWAEQQTLALVPLWPILVCLWVCHTFSLKFPSSFFNSWLSRVPWSPVGMVWGHSVACPGKAGSGTVTACCWLQPPVPLSLRAQRASCCALPGRAPHSTPLLPGLGLPQQALCHPQRSAALAGSPEVVAPLPQVGLPRWDVGGALWRLGTG